MTYCCCAAEEGSHDTAAMARAPATRPPQLQGHALPQLGAQSGLTPWASDDPLRLPEARPSPWVQTSRGTGLSGQIRGVSTWRFPVYVGVLSALRLTFKTRIKVISIFFTMEILNILSTVYPPPRYVTAILLYCVSVHIHLCPFVLLIHDVLLLHFERNCRRQCASL